MEEGTNQQGAGSQEPPYSEVVLKKQRGSLKGKITRVQAFVDTVTLDTTVEELTARLEGLETAFREYSGIHWQLLASCRDEDEAAHEQHLTEVEDKYYSIKAKLQLFINSRTPQRNTSPAPSASIPRSVPGQADVKLPRIQLPTFSGNYLEWSSFRDLFSSLIHNNLKISDSQKLHYLKTSLTGEAAALLQSLDITDANYIQAWELLNDRYQNSRQLIQCHMKAIFGQPSLSGESATGIRKLLDTTSKHVRALNALDVKTENWDHVLVFHLTERLDAETRREWELHYAKKEYPTFTELKEYLEKRCRALEASRGQLRSERKMQPSHNVMKLNKPATSLHSTWPHKTCAVCSGPHAVYRCADILNRDSNQRMDMVRKYSLCVNCLGTSKHQLKLCPSKSNCQKCGARHHTLLHDSLAKQATDAGTSQIPSTSRTDQVSTHFSQQPSVQRVMLATAMVKVKDSVGAWQNCRLLLDSGSEATFVSESCVARLGLKRSKANVEVTGIGQCTSGVTRGLVMLELKSNNTTSFRLSTKAFILTKLTNYKPQLQSEAMHWAQNLNISLADNFNSSQDIDIILGAEYFTEIIVDGKIPSSTDHPAAFNTKLGWVLSGTLPCATSQKTLSINHARIELDQQLQRFWELEELPPARQMTAEEQACEKHFETTHTRMADGRYCVRLPVREDPPHLGQSRDMAAYRLSQLTKRLERDTEKQRQYCEFMDEYLNLNHMEVVPPSQSSGSSPDINYLPHHFVLKPDSSTTSLRVVFDASARTTSGASLNDCLMVGPKIQDDIWDLILRFRTWKVAFTADIAKMYRQIRVTDEDADLQRILWRSPGSSSIEEFRLKTVTYGTAAAPYLAVRTIHQLAMDEAERFPLAAKVATSDFYVDDLISGAPTLEEALRVQAELLDMMASGGFQLRKWASNEPQVLQHLPATSLTNSASFAMGEHELTKTLGIEWHPQDDYFGFTVKPLKTPARITKRVIVSEASKLYDPLGWLSPIVIVAKILIQELWASGVSWDDESPPELQAQWHSYSQSFECIANIQIPRYIGLDASSRMQLHGFSDASERAYSAVIYVRCVDQQSGSYSTHLLCAKTRVAPLRQVSLPRLELCGALLLAKLVTRAIGVLGERVESVNAWTDSSICLAWLKKPPRTWKTFVANRVSIIQELIPPHQWRHVASSDNPADVASRGVCASELLKSPLWWSGPSWLCRSDDQWPATVCLPEGQAQSAVKAEMRKINASLCIPVNTASHTQMTLEIVSNVSSTANSVPRVEWPLMNETSSLTKLIRVTGWCRRFIHNAKQVTADRLRGPLSAIELHQALMTCVKAVQCSEFAKELQCIQDQPSLKHSHLSSLNPFVDDAGILRVGGRLRNTKLNYNQRCPILLPKGHHFCELVVVDTHLKHLHAGPQATLAAIQQRYWIVNGRSLVRRIIHKCHKCIRFRGQTLQHQMGDLPNERTEAVRPFLRVGVDFGGPFQVRTQRGRGGRATKYYMALFVCLATKAIHLEAVSDLSSDAFIAAFKRFMARRGRCAHIISDNGTNFVGADAELKRLSVATRDAKFNDDIASQLANEGVTWHFIPPRAPHFGGLWEAGIKSTKAHLRRVMGQTILHLEEFTTLLAQVEACLNSRPLCALSTDPNDLAVLTPGHFLIGEPLTAIPEPDLTNITINRLSRWQLTQQLFQRFWKRWHQEYLVQLHQRPKWRNQMPNIKCGDLVLIKDDHIPPLKWPKGRVIDIHPGKDQQVRVVSLRTAAGTMKRPVMKLIMLPTS